MNLLSISFNAVWPCLFSMPCLSILSEKAGDRDKEYRLNRDCFAPTVNHRSLILHVMRLRVWRSFIGI